MVILGTSASGLDISREIAGVAEVVYLSGRNHKIQPEMVGGRAVGSNNNIFLKPNIAQLKSSGGVLFDVRLAKPCFLIRCAPCRLSFSKIDLLC